LIVVCFLGHPEHTNDSEDRIHTIINSSSATKERLLHKEVNGWPAFFLI